MAVVYERWIPTLKFGPRAALTLRGVVQSEIVRPTAKTLLPSDMLYNYCGMPCQAPPHQTLLQATGRLSIL